MSFNPLSRLLDIPSIIACVIIGFYHLPIYYLVIAVIPQFISIAIDSHRATMLSINENKWHLVFIGWSIQYFGATLGGLWQYGIGYIIEIIISFFA